MEEQAFTETALREFKQGLGIFMEKMPNIAKSFNSFTEACFEEGKLDRKQKQLIALSISVFAQDEYCMIYHTKGCLDEGCSEDEMMEALGVALAFGGGPAMSQAVTLVQQSIKEFKRSAPH